MMSLFPDQYFHLGLDEVRTSSLCTTESKDNFLSIRENKNSSPFLFFLPNEQRYKAAPERMNAAANSERAKSKTNQGSRKRMDKRIETNDSVLEINKLLNLSLHIFLKLLYFFLFLFLFFFFALTDTKSLEQELMEFLVQNSRIPVAWQEALTSTSAVSCFVQWLLSYQTYRTWIRVCSCETFDVFVVISTIIVMIIVII